jgi:type IV secretory pathway TrbL component
METSNKSNLMDWVLFLASTVVLVFMLIYVNEWFWLALPFSLTYLVKALKVM